MVEIRFSRWVCIGAVVAAAGLAGAVSAQVPAAADSAPASGTLQGAQLARFGAPSSATPGPDGPNSFDATLPNGRRVTPAGTSVQIGQNPLNSVLTPDGKYLITTNDDERGKPGTTGASIDPADTKNGVDAAVSQYSLAVVDTATMKIVAAVPVPKRLAPPNPGPSANGRTDSDATNGLFLGLAALPAQNGYTVYAAGGVSDVLYKLSLGADGTAAAAPTQIPLPVPQDKSQATYGMAMPGWLTPSTDGKTLYVVNNQGNSVTPVDLATDTPGVPLPVGYFPYAAQQFGSKLFVSNWGVTDRAFADGAGTTNPTTGVVTHTGTAFVGGASTNLFANPATDPQKSSSLTVLDLNGGQGDSISLARPIDGVNIVGGTHPSALALVNNGATGSALYVANSNEDSVVIVDPRTETVVGRIGLGQGAPAGSIGVVPDALAVSPDKTRLYVAEAGLNAVGVYDITNPQAPSFRGLIPTGWYPTGVTVSPDGSALYVTNAKGAGSPYGYRGTFVSPGVYTNPDVNNVFGSVQKVDLGTLDLSGATSQVADDTVVVKSYDSQKLAILQQNIKHVVFILRENKSYDTYFGDDATLNARGANGDPNYAQYGPYVPNSKALAEQFAIGDNNYADSEESNAGHSFALAGTSTDYQQKTLLTRFPRPLVDVKNEDPEDSPLRGYMFNAMARADRTFRDYGDNLRVSGYDEGGSGNFCADDPKPNCSNATYNNIADTTSPTSNLGGLYSETVPALKVLDGNIDTNYPGWNLRISDQRRATEFIRDYSRLVAAGNAPQFTFIWLPGDHTGGCSSNSTPCTPQQEVADNDAAYGQIVDYLSHASTWPSTAIFVTQDDSQGSPDHVSPRRTYTTVISPWAQHGKVIHTLGSTVSIPKTIEEILNLPSMNIGDLVANDLLDYFTTKPDFTPYTTSTPSPATTSAVTRSAAAQVPRVTMRIWALTAKLNDRTYDSDTARLGELTRLYFASLKLSVHKGELPTATYTARQDRLYAQAESVVS